jgi:hypothetical protein
MFTKAPPPIKDPKGLKEGELNAKAKPDNSKAGGAPSRIFLLATAMIIA